MHHSMCRDDENVLFRHFPAEYMLNKVLDELTQNLFFSKNSWKFSSGKFIEGSMMEKYFSEHCAVNDTCGKQHIEHLRV